MSSYCLLFLCLFCAHTSLSQVPGYQGKRFFAEVGTSFWINDSNPRANNVGFERFPDNRLDQRVFTLQEHYFLNLNYVLSRKIVFSLEYEYSKTGLHTRENIGIFTPADWGTITKSRVTYGLFDLHNLFYQLYTHKMNFSFSHYFNAKGNLAPLGFYMKWGFDLALSKGVLMDQKVTYGHDFDFNDNKPSEKFTNPTGINSDQIIPMYGLHWGMGYRGIIANRITWNLAIQSTLFPQIFNSNREKVFQAEREGQYEDRNNLNYINRVYQRVQAHYYLNIVVGIGVLIY